MASELPPIPDGSPSTAPVPALKGNARRGGANPVLAAAAAVAVVYAAICKCLLFRNLEYSTSDLFSFLEHSWSWYYSGLFFHDNAYGRGYAIHNFLLMPFFSVLTLPFGAYGLVIGLAALWLVAALRITTAGHLSVSARATVLAMLLSPAAYYLFDHPRYGFHPELCYVPLAALLAIELVEGRPRAATLVAAVIVLVKEDGAILCGSILVAYFAARLWDSRSGPRRERLRTLGAAALSLSTLALVFVAGIVALTIASSGLGSTQLTAAGRTSTAVKALGDLLRNGGPERARLFDGLLGHALFAAALLVALGRRALRAGALVLLSSPPLGVVLAVAASTYGLQLMMWPPRLATSLALALACSVVAAAKQAPAGAVPVTVSGSRMRAAVATIACILLSWGGQLVLLSGLEYSPGPRLDIRALASGRGCRVERLGTDELRFLRCVADHLPAGLPILAYADVHPLFHRQSIVFPRRQKYAARPPLVRITSIEQPHPPFVPPCRGPRVGRFAVEGDCRVLQLVAHCGSGGTANSP